MDSDADALPRRSENNDQQPQASPESRQSSAIDHDVAGPLPYLRRPTSAYRKGSIQSDTSRRSVLTSESTDSLLLPRVNPSGEAEEHEEPNLWHSLPLLFAVLPAVGGVFFKKGSVFLTDLALLVLATLYLNWCLATPWIWYRSAQTIVLENDFEFQEAEIPESAVDDAIDSVTDAVNGDRENGSSIGPRERVGPSKRNAKADEAMRELHMHEITALALCFFGPLLGSYVLHVIRSQLSTLGDELVSNLHLTLFVLCAEIRPLRLAIKMAQKRTIFLQRVLQENPYTQEGTKASEKDLPGVGILLQRIEELEHRAGTESPDKGTKQKSPDNIEAIKRLHGSLQTQIDALNRATRRYEKRATVQTMQTEARLQELDTRLREVVSIAAAAANYSQKPNSISLFPLWIKSLIMAPFLLAYNFLVYPMRILSQALIKLALAFGIVRRQSRKQLGPAIRTKSATTAGSVRRGVR